MGVLDSGLILAAIGAITYVAYQYPYAFKELQLVFRVLYIIASILLLTWFLSSQWAFSSVTDFIESGKYEEARAAFEANQPPAIRLFIILFGGLLYIELLYLLPDLLGDEYKAKHNPKKKDSDEDSESGE